MRERVEPGRGRAARPHGRFTPMRLVVALGAAVIAALAAWATLVLLPTQDAPYALPFTSTDASALAEWAEYHRAHPERGVDATFVDSIVNTNAVTQAVTAGDAGLTPATWLDPDFPYRHGLAIGVAVASMTAAALIVRAIERRRPD